MLKYNYDMGRNGSNAVPDVFQMAGGGNLVMGNFDLNEEIRAVIREIMDYKWIESEKEGKDIGLSRATKEWISKYYDTWFRFNAQHFMKDK